MKAPTVTTLRCWLFALLAIGCVIAASPVLRDVSRQRTELGLIPFTDTGDLPPEIVTPAMALGPFRAIFIDVLWMRAIQLQDDGQYFELVQLYDWISKLEPRFPLVWEYMAWNFAYNISVKFPVPPRPEAPIAEDSDPRELRWQWVSRGIETLRDQGIYYNPRAYSLYRELAWLFSHKIGQNADDAHLYYKVRLALLMQAAMGLPPYFERLQAIAAAPLTEAGLLADPAMAALVARLRDAGIDPMAKPLDVANRKADLPAAARAILDAPDQAALVERLDYFLRGQYLRHTLKLDPARMLDLMKRYGPVEVPGKVLSIDWRLPDALALYWANRSLEVAALALDREQAVNADRIQFHSLANLYRRGRLIVRPLEPGKPPIWIASPNFAFLDRIVKLHQADEKFFEGKPEQVPYHEGYLNFLREAIVDLYLSNQVPRAAHYYRMLLAIGPEDKTLTLDEFIAGRWKEIAKTLNADQCAKFIQEIYLRAYYWASLGDLDQAAGQERLAQLLAHVYQRERPHLPLAPLREMRRAAFRQALRVFQEFQVQRLRELYPKEVVELETEIAKEKEQAPPPPPKKPAGSPK